MRGIVPRLELSLIVLMVTGGVLILQRWDFVAFQIGLIIMVGATLINIAVGNLPRDASPLRTLLLTLVILSIVGILFGVGILLVPILSEMGQGS